jgi:hypothetical protein
MKAERDPCRNLDLKVGSKLLCEPKQDSRVRFIKIYSKLGLKPNLRVSFDTWFQIAMKTRTQPKGIVCENILESGSQFI